MQDRNSNRKLDFDYSQDAIYFITINTKNKIHHFGKIRNGKMELNELGKLLRLKFFGDLKSTCIDNYITNNPENWDIYKYYGI